MSDLPLCEKCKTPIEWYGSVLVFDMSMNFCNKCGTEIGQILERTRHEEIKKFLATNLNTNP